ncbi:MAG: deoxyribose-phosphate aldolase, partial [Planctomycetota bacterium]|nr:deoxyribose-phosphate aldolase [Planctomycetota bacterium]
MDYAYDDLAKMIDHALLNPATTDAQFEQGIDLALAYDVASVCIMPYYLKRCAERLAGSTVKASTVIGFPHGGQTTDLKRLEAQRALEDGCQELDLVVNISKVLSSDWQYVQDDIQPIIEVTHAAKQKVKIIFENCYLGDEQKIKLCQICSELSADWVKTSTGFGTSGATHEDLQLMRSHAAKQVQVKAAGGVRDIDGLIAVRKLGATRCGSSQTQKILDAARERLN